MVDDGRPEAIADPAGMERKQVGEDVSGLRGLGDVSIGEVCEARPCVAERARVERLGPTHPPHHIQFNITSRFKSTSI